MWWGSWEFRMIWEAVLLAPDLKLPSKYLSSWRSPLNCCQGPLLIHFLRFCLVAGLVFQEKQPLAWTFLSLRKFEPACATVVVSNREPVGSSRPWTVYPWSCLWGQGTVGRPNQWVQYKDEWAEICLSQGELQPRCPASCAEGSPTRGLLSSCGWCTALWLRDRDVGAV